jgi:hypothetical protein
MKHLTLIFITILCYTDLFSQNDINKTEYNQEESRSFFLYANIGILDFASVGVGYQASERVALSIKASQTFITGASLGFPEWGAGLGFKVSCATEFLFFNSISAEYIAYLETSIDDSHSLTSTLKGNYFDFNIGRENVYDEGINVFWAIGICISSVKTTEVLFSPSLKVGLNYNFH